MWIGRGDDKSKTVNKMSFEEKDVNNILNKNNKCRMEEIKFKSSNRAHSINIVMCPWYHYIKSHL